jgi:hypothetical protein
MREICTSGSVGGLGRPIVAALGLPDLPRGPHGPRRGTVAPSSARSCANNLEAALT